MKLLLLISVVVSIDFFSGSQSILRTNASVSAEKNVVQVNRAWLEAISHCDKLALSQVIADDCIITDELGGVGSKAQFIELLQSKRPEDCKSEDLSLTEVRVRSFGPTSIITGLMSAGQGERVGVRFTNVFVHRNGIWSLVASQNTRVLSVRLEPIKPPK